MKMLKPTQGGSRRPLRVTAIALSSAAIGALAVGMTSVEAQNPSVAMQPVSQNMTPAWPGYADLVEKVMPAVVSVTTKRKMSNALVGGEISGTPAISSGSSRSSRVRQRDVQALHGALRPRRPAL